MIRLDYGTKDLVEIFEQKKEFCRTSRGNCETCLYGILFNPNCNIKNLTKDEFISLINSEANNEH